MKFHVWPFPIFVIYPHDAGLTRLFLDFAAADDLVLLKNSSYYVEVFSPKLGSLNIWNENRWYAWASRGEFVAVDGTGSSWAERRPSRYAMRSMRQRLFSLGGLDFVPKEFPYPPAPSEPDPPRI